MLGPPRFEFSWNCQTLWKARRQAGSKSKWGPGGRQGKPRRALASDAPRRSLYDEVAHDFSSRRRCAPVPEPHGGVPHRVPLMSH